MSIHPPGEARSRYDLYHTQTLLVWTNIPLQSRGFCNKTLSYSSLVIPVDFLSCIDKSWQIDLIMNTCHKDHIDSILLCYC